MIFSFDGWVTPHFRSKSKFQVLNLKKIFKKKKKKKKETTVSESMKIFALEFLQYNLLIELCWSSIEMHMVNALFNCVPSQGLLDMKY